MTQENYIVTARKWRPQTFEDVVGQEHITTTLKNAISNDRIHHAYLFCGPRGVGKTTTARIYARAINCLNPKQSEPCNECENCRAMLDSRSTTIIEIDGASNNSVDDIRKLREDARYAPSTGKYKLYIIDEVHMLSTSAFNALLKTLEEPPGHLLFVFATTEAHKVPATIISRCQRFDFRRMEINEVVERLKFISQNEGINIDEESLVAIAKKGDGSMRDSQSIFDQARAFCGKDIKYSELADALQLIDEDFYFRIMKAAADGDVNDMFLASIEVIRKGYDLTDCLNGLLESFRNLLTVKVTGDTRYIETSSLFQLKYKELANRFSKEDILRFVNHIINAVQALKFAPQPRIRFELALAQLASMDKTSQISQLIQELNNLKNNSGGFIPGPSEKKNLKAEAEKIAEAEAEPVKERPKEPLTEDNFDERWAEYIAAKPDSAISYMNSLTPLFTGSEIILKTPKNFIFEVASKKKQLLESSVQNYFGQDYRVEVMFVEDAEAPYSDEIGDAADESPQAAPASAPAIQAPVKPEAKIIKEEISSSNQSQTKSARKLHPFELYLLNMGAEELK